MARVVKIRIDDAVYAAMEKRALEEGFLGVAPLVRKFVVQAVAPESERRLITIPQKDYLEFEEYVKAKRLGSVDTFAGYAMELTMSRAPLSEAQKARVKESIV